MNSRGLSLVRPPPGWPGTLADLRPNDTVVVTGIPTTIAASQLQIGELPPLPFGAMMGGGGQGPGAPPPAPPGEAAPLTLPTVQQTSRVTGTVVSTNPL